MSTISKLARQKLHECLGDFADYGFKLIPGYHCLELWFKDNFIHRFPTGDKTLISAADVQNKCGEYFNTLNAQYN